jgi:hypothetical protein
MESVGSGHQGGFHLTLRLLQFGRRAMLIATVVGFRLFLAHERVFGEAK